MSEWYEIKERDCVELSDDGKNIEILFDTTEFGNRYIVVPLNFINELTPKKKPVEKMKCDL